MLNKFLNGVILKNCKKIFRFECRLLLKEFKNRYFYFVTCTYKIYLTIICNIIIFTGIYKKILLNLCFRPKYSSPDFFSRTGRLSRHTGYRFVNQKLFKRRVTWISFDNPVYQEETIIILLIFIKLIFPQGKLYLEFLLEIKPVLMEAEARLILKFT